MDLRSQRLMIRWDRVGEMVVPGFVLGMIWWWCWSNKFRSVFIMRSGRRGGYPRVCFVGVGGIVVITTQLEVVVPKRVALCGKMITGRNEISGGIIIIAIQKVCFIAKMQYWFAIFFSKSLSTGRNRVIVVRGSFVKFSEIITIQWPSGDVSR